MAAGCGRSSQRARYGAKVRCGRWGSPWRSRVPRLPATVTGPPPQRGVGDERSGAGADPGRHASSAVCRASAPRSGTGAHRGADSPAAGHRSARAVAIDLRAESAGRPPPDLRSGGQQRPGATPHGRPGAIAESRLRRKRPGRTLAQKPARDGRGLRSAARPPAAESSERGNGTLPPRRLRPGCRRFGIRAAARVERRTASAAGYHMPGGHMPDGRRRLSPPPSIATCATSRCPPARRPRRCRAPTAARSARRSPRGPADGRRSPPGSAPASPAARRGARAPCGPR